MIKKKINIYIIVQYYGQYISVYNDPCKHKTEILKLNFQYMKDIVNWMKHNKYKFEIYYYQIQQKLKYLETNMNKMKQIYFIGKF